MDAPHLIVEVRLGPRRGTKAVLRPGEALAVGRSDLADLAVPEDASLSPRHFELRWDGARSRLRDLGGRGGTRLNGEPVTDAEVPHGGWIRAGGNDFTVYVEGHTPPAPVEDDPPDPPDAEDDDAEPEGAPAFAAEPVEPSPEDEPEDADEREERLRFQAAHQVERRQERRGREARAEAAARALPILQAVAEESALHAVLDAARAPRILEVLREAIEDHRSLYEGAQGTALEEVAPYLVRLAPGSRLLAQLTGEGWMRRWGIFAEGTVPRRELRRHFRRFLMVEDESGAPLYFRFYDPGVLRDFWPSCARRQLVDLLGPLRAFLVEGERGEVLRLTATGKVEPWSGPLLAGSG